MTIKERGNTPDKKVIHKYWQGKASTDVEWIVKLVGEDAHNYITMGNGCVCYACGKEDKHLERCHIVPHSLGGTNTVDNLFLMCHNCHAANPDTIYEDIFFAYIRNKEPFLNSKLREIYDIFKYLKSEASETEVNNFERNMEDLSSTDAITLISKPCIKTISTGLRNSMSTATAVSYAWKIFSASTLPLLHTEPALHQTPHDNP